MYILCNDKTCLRQLEPAQLYHHYSSTTSLEPIDAVRSNKYQHVIILVIKNTHIHSVQLPHMWCFHAMASVRIKTQTKCHFGTDVVRITISRGLEYTPKRRTISFHPRSQQAVIKIYHRNIISCKYCEHGSNLFSSRWIQAEVNSRATSKKWDVGCWQRCILLRVELCMDFRGFDFLLLWKEWLILSRGGGEFFGTFCTRKMQEVCLHRGWQRPCMKATKNDAFLANYIPVRIQHIRCNFPFNIELTFRPEYYIQHPPCLTMS